MYPLDREPAEGRPFLSDQRDQEQGQLSPDGHWVAYVSNQNGPREVFVASVVRDPATDFVSAGPGTPVSKGGGVSPRWSHGGELFYLTTDGAVMAVAGNSNHRFGLTTATQVLRAPGVLPDWGVSPDGNHFLLAIPMRTPPLFDVFLNWDVRLTR